MPEETYAIYDDTTGDIVNTIVYDGVAKYDEKVFHGATAKKVKLKKTNSGESVGIGDKYDKISKEFKKK